MNVSVRNEKRTCWFRSVHYAARLTMALGIAAFASAVFGGEDATATVAVVAVPIEGEVFAARADSRGAIHVLVQTPDGPRYLVTRDNGATFGKPLAVVDAASRKPGLVYSVWDLAVSPEGQVHVAMGTNGWKLKLPKEEWAFFYARRAPGDAEFSAVRNLNRQPSEGFSLAADGRGNVTACWLSGKLYASRSRDNGKTFDAAAEIDPSFDPCDCCTTSSSYAEDGRLAVLYREESNNERDMYVVLWDQQRDEVKRTRVSTTAWKIDGCPMTYYSIAPRADGFVAAWPTKGDVYFARLDKRGEPLAPPEVKAPGRVGTRTGLLALAGEDGRTLVAWKADGRFHWQLYDASCRAIGKRGSIDSAGAGVAGARTKQGGFVLFR